MMRPHGGPQQRDCYSTLPRRTAPASTPYLYNAPEHGIVEDTLDPLREGEAAQILPTWTIQIKAPRPVADANAHAGALFAQQPINQSMTATNGLMCCPSAEDQNLQQS
jgi:hypothetical protein